MADRGYGLQRYEVYKFAYSLRMRSKNKIIHIDMKSTNSQIHRDMKSTNSQSSQRYEVYKFAYSQRSKVYKLLIWLFWHDEAGASWGLFTNTC